MNQTRIRVAMGLLCALCACVVNAAPQLFECDGNDLAAQKQKYAAGDKTAVRIVKDICIIYLKSVGLTPNKMLIFDGGSHKEEFSIH